MKKWQENITSEYSHKHDINEKIRQCKLIKKKKLQT